MKKSVVRTTLFRSKKSVDRAGFFYEKLNILVYIVKFSQYKIECFFYKINKPSSKNSLEIKFVCLIHTN